MRKSPLTEAYVQRFRFLSRDINVENCLFFSAVGLQGETVGLFKAEEEYKNNTTSNCLINEADLITIFSQLKQANTYNDNTSFQLRYLARMQIH